MAARKKKGVAKKSKMSARKKTGTKKAPASKKRSKKATTGKKPLRSAKTSTAKKADVVYSDIRGSMRSALLRRFI